MTAGMSEVSKNGAAPPQVLSRRRRRRIGDPGGRDVRVAQPSLSRQLRQLEAELDTALFDRSQGRLRLTAAGTRFVPIARDLMARAQTAETTMRSLADNRDVGLVVAASATTIVDVIAPFIAMSGSDGAIVNVFEDLPNHVYAALTNSAADLAVTTSPAPPTWSPDWSSAPASGRHVATDHAWSGRGAVDLAELVQEPLIVLDETHGTRRLLDQVVAAAGLHYDVVREVGAPQIAHALAAAGHGVAVLSDDPRYGLTPMSIGNLRGTPRHTAVRCLGPHPLRAGDDRALCAGDVDVLPDALLDLTRVSRSLSRQAAARGTSPRTSPHPPSAAHPPGACRPADA
jgi:DNA-binding transcriptional LysR family regulator